MAAGPKPRTRRRRSRTAQPAAPRRPASTFAQRQAWRTAEDAALEARVAERIADSLRLHAAQPDRIERRLRELDAEWSVERLLQTNGAALALAGAVYGIVARRRWLLLSALASGCLLQYAVQGHAPPVRSLRRMGARTNREIERERYGLKALRGDFDSLPRAKNDAGKNDSALPAAILTALRR